MSSSDPISCNRQPFLSDKECDRGNVDIHQFDDFPYCESFSPTLPEIPPEIVDTPLNIPIPPACACFSIDYAMKLKYNQNRKFAAAAEFSAKGDCCEGQYVTNLDLEIPCPIIGNGSSKRIKMKLGYGNGNKSADVSYIRTDKDSCTVEAKDVDINLNLPCPIKDPGTRKVKIGISYGAKFKGASAKVVEPNATNCTIEPLSPTFNINIPCPIKAPTGRKIKIGISYGKTFRSASASFIKANSVNCTIEALSPSFRLNIPCPIVGREETYNKIRAKIKWGSTKSFSASYIRTNVVDCTLEPKDVNIDLQLRCPIHNAQNAPKIKARIGYGNSGRSASVSFLTADSKNCEIQGKDVNLDLRIPCPVRGSLDGKNKVRLGIKWGNNNSPVSASLIVADPEKCEIQTNSATFNLQIRCPVKHSEFHKKVGNICYPRFRRRWVNAGSWTRTYKSYSGNFDFIKINESSCTVEVGRLDLDIPCPVKHSEFHKKVGNICYPRFRRRWVNAGSWTRTYKSYSGNFDFIKINESSCTVEVGRLDLDIPCPVKHSEFHYKKGSYCWAKWRRRWTGNGWTAGWSSHSTDFIKINESSCTIEVGKFDLEIPCPVARNKLIIEASTSYASSKPAKIWIESSSFSGPNCYRRIKIRARFGNTNSSTSVIKDIRYYASKHAFQIKTYNLKTKKVSEWKDVFTAVNHRSDHVNCNDV